MGRIIHLHGDPHAETRRLMPWYATGRAEPADVAPIEAHLATCADCRAELALERRLRGLIAAMPPQQASGWAALHARAEAAPSGGPAALRRAAAAAPRRRWIGWLAAPVAAGLLAALVFGIDRPVRYEALGAGAPDPRGDIIVMFDPDARERDVRRALQRSGARLVDGPTAAAAYVLDVAPSRRAAALAALRADPGIVMAEPVGGDPGR